jgi:hypothetical protein
VSVRWRLNYLAALQTSKGELTIGETSNRIAVRQVQLHSTHS